MIIVNMSGGLGNQLFQYIAGKTLALVTRRSLTLNTARYVKPNERRSFQLFDAIEHDSSVEVVTRKDVLLSKYEKVLRLCRVRKKKQDMHVVSEPNFFQLLNGRYDRTPLLLDGYFQDTRFFLGHDPSRLITLRDSGHSPVDTGGRKVIAVHMRRGDYLLPKHSIHGITPDWYYEQALKAAKAMFPDALTLLYSDDKEVTTAFPVDVRVSDLNLTDMEEFLLLSRSDAFIISNSTFAWWAAVLAGSAFVYAPRRWYRDKDALDTFFPDGWKTI